MDNDDILSPIIGRRQLLRSAGALGIFGLGLSRLGTARPLSSLETPQDVDISDLIDEAALQSMCVITPGETEGPYYLNLNLLRSDITEGFPGLATRLFVNVVHASDCTPVPNAAVDVWHCNAAGAYSGFANQGTQGQTFLRGVQITDANGQTFFDTIYPGWYMGRTTHIHVKVRPTMTTELTSQLYFPQRLNKRVNTIAPYSAHGQNPQTNFTDGLYLPATVVSLLAVGPLQVALTIGVA